MDAPPVSQLADTNPIAADQSLFFRVTPSLHLPFCCNRIVIAPKYCEKIKLTGRLMAV
jgi:hypothetical protein